MTGATSEELRAGEEANTGADVPTADSWPTDHDRKDILDGSNSNESSQRAGAIFAIPVDLHTNPAGTRTSRDSLTDNPDCTLSGDAFVDVLVYSVTPAGTGASDGDATFQPFGSITVGSETSYSPCVSAAPGTQVNLKQRYTVNVDDATPTVSITIRAWDYDTRVENGNHDDVHTALAVATDTSYGGCSGVTPWMFTYALWTSLPPLTSSGTCSGATYLRADPITVAVATVAPPRVEALLVVPRDYSGVYNARTPPARPFPAAPSASRGSSRSS